MINLTNTLNVVGFRSYSNWVAHNITCSWIQKLLKLGST